MENNKIIMQEIMEVAPTLASISRQMPYALPEGYFDVFPVEMLSVLSPKQPGFSVPEGYFENLPALLLAKAKASTPVTVEVEVGETEPALELLNSISKKMPYTVPAHYFEQFQVEVPGQEARVIPMHRPFRRAMGWAVAASILALVSLFGYRFLNNSGEDVNPGNTSNAAIAQSETGFEDSMTAIQLAEALSAVDEGNLKAELDKYSGAEKSVVHYYTTNNIESALKGISAEEIKKSLELEGYIYMKS